MSLRHKLVLLLSGLTVLAVGVAMAAAWGDVRQTAEAAADQRLGRLAERIASMAQAWIAARVDLLRRVGDDPTVRAALRGAPLDSAGLIGALSDLREPSDTDLGVWLLDWREEPIFSDRPGGLLSEPRPPLDSVPTYGGMRAVDGEVRYWNTAPVTAEDGSVLGWIAQERRLGSTEATRQIEDLIGPGTQVYYAIAGEDLGASLSGHPVMLRADELATDSLLTLLRDSVPYLARVAPVPRTPWLMLVETPTATVESRGTLFLRRMGGLAALLVLATVLVAYPLGRRLTDPIEELAAATEGLARGDYDQEIRVTRGGDELDRLARSFNEMAQTMAASRAAMDERLEQERTLVRELDEAKVRADRALDEAQRANRAKAEFLATMSHEIRTPINAVIGYCDLLELEISGTLAPGQQEKVARIRRSSEILGALVEDVLDFAKLDSGQFRLDMIVAPIRDAALVASRVLEPQAERDGLTIDIAVPPELRFVGDPRRVEQILVNLVSNAVKFTSQGGVVMRAEVGGEGPPSARPPATGERDRDWLRVEVEDTGEGIPEELQVRMFEPFVQGDTGYTRRYGGTGLGLSISRELALMMGGDLTVRSRPHEGSTFTLWLRAADDEPSSRERDGAADRGEAGGGDGAVERDGTVERDEAAA